MTNREIALAVALLERAKDAVDPDFYPDLCADLERFLNGPLSETSDSE